MESSRALWPQESRVWEQGHLIKHMRQALLRQRMCSIGEGPGDANEYVPDILQIFPASSEHTWVIPPPSSACIRLDGEASNIKSEIYISLRELSTCELKRLHCAIYEETCKRLKRSKRLTGPHVS